MPIKQEYFGVMIMSFILAVIITEGVNYFTDKTNRIRTAINRIGNDLEKLLLYSIDQRQLIQITLKNDKVYVGICGNIPVPDKTTFIDIVPFFSGFRDPKDKTLTFNTDYLSVYSEYMKKGDIMSITDLNVNILIRSDEILPASMFETDIYEKFGHQSELGSEIKD